jgi:hypothetical protein
MFSSSRKPRTPPSGSGRNFLAFACAVGLGAALMFLFDPDNGRRRRSLLTNKPGSPADDNVLVERVRAALVLVVPDANGIDVKVRDGCVILKGPVTHDQMGEIVACARRVRGVQQVENRLSPNSAQGAAQ